MKTKPTKPLIGLTCLSLSSSDWVQNAPGTYLDVVFREYSRGVESAGGLPVLIPVFKDLETNCEVLERIDGLLLTGGRDICPRFFDEERSAKDELWCDGWPDAGTGACADGTADPALGSGCANSC